MLPVRFTESTIGSAAAVAGSGASVLRGVNADLYLTGEMSHHDVLDAVHNNVTVVLANHSNTERNYLKVFAGRLLKEMPLLDVHVSKVDRDPLTFVWLLYNNVYCIIILRYRAQYFRLFLIFVSRLLLPHHITKIIQIS